VFDEHLTKTVLDRMLQPVLWKLCHETDAIAKHAVGQVLAILDNGSLSRAASEVRQLSVPHVVYLVFYLDLHDRMFTGLLTRGHLISLINRNDLRR
jgi:hypothetical protein